MLLQSLDHKGSRFWSDSENLNCEIKTNLSKIEGEINKSSGGSVTTELEGDDRLAQLNKYSNA